MKKGYNIWSNQFNSINCLCEEVGSIKIKLLRVENWCIIYENQLQFSNKKLLRKKFKGN